MKSIREADVKNKRALVRADFNVTLTNDGQVLDDFRIRTALPTIKHLIKEKAKIILMSHLGRPEGKVNEKLRLSPVQNKLLEYLDVSVTKASDCLGQELKGQTDKMKPGEILLLENLRFHRAELDNDKDFASKLAHLADIYINDAFGVCHRSHASVVAITKFLPSYAGILLEKEIKVLSDVLDNFEAPLCVIIGGAKISTKIKVIQQFLTKADDVLLGGALANTVLHAQGVAVGESLIEKQVVPEVRELKITDSKLHLPVDALASTDKTGQAPIRTTSVGKTNQDELILDIGPDTRVLFSQIISKAKTIIWNGPMGLFEIDKFIHGTKAIAQAISQSSAFSVVGGGETIAYLEKAGLVDKFSHVSTGGGAMLKFLVGEKLPGLEALEQSEGS